MRQSSVMSDQTGNWDTSAPVIVSRTAGRRETTSTATISGRPTSRPQRLSYPGECVHVALTGASLTTAHSISLNGLSAAAMYQYLLQYIKTAAAMRRLPCHALLYRRGCHAAGTFLHWRYGDRRAGNMQVVWNTNEPSDSRWTMARRPRTVRLSRYPPMRRSSRCMR